MQQVLVNLPLVNFPIYGFGAMLFLAFVLVTWWGMRRGLRIGVPREKIQDLALALLLPG